MAEVFACTYFLQKLEKASASDAAESVWNMFPQLDTFWVMFCWSQACWFQKPINIQYTVDEVKPTVPELNR